MTNANFHVSSVALTCLKLQFLLPPYGRIQAGHSLRHSRVACNGGGEEHGCCGSGRRHRGRRRRLRQPVGRQRLLDGVQIQVRRNVDVGSSSQEARLSDLRRTGRLNSAMCGWRRSPVSIAARVPRRSTVALKHNKWARDGFCKFSASSTQLTKISFKNPS